jgi:hypothetical protein
MANVQVTKGDFLTSDFCRAGKAPASPALCQRFDKASGSASDVYWVIG